MDARREARYRALLDAAGDAIVSLDEAGAIESWNRAAEHVFGRTAEEVLGRPLETLLPTAHRPELLDTLRRLERGPGNEAVREILQVEGLSRDGRRFPAELTLVSSLVGDRPLTVAVFRDVSQQVAAEEELRLIGSATAHVRDAIVVSTVGSGPPAPSILYVNAAFSRMTGWAEAEALGRSFGLLAGPSTERRLLQHVNERLGRGEPVTVEITAHRKDGTPFLLDWRATPIPEPDGSVRHAVSIQRDVTDERRMEQELRRVDRDALTELANRRVLESSLRRTMERAAANPELRFALLFLDLDGFKTVNDEHGHVVGDRLLSAAARRLERTVRPGDLLSRFGGDEFVILVGSVTELVDVTMVAERVSERLAEPFDIGGAELSIAVSIGIALSDNGYDGPEAMIAAADAAMYEAKRKGKGRMEFA